MDEAELIHSARGAAGDAGAALEFAAKYGDVLPVPGRGETAKRWAALRAVAGIDLTVARVLEAHTDALAIFAEAGESAEAGTWGVFAAQAPGTVLLTSRSRDGANWLYGSKPWCSLAHRLDHALVTAHRGTDSILYAVDLRGPGVQTDPGCGWISRGLADVSSGSVQFEGAAARQVGSAGWYLQRPGFSWGAIGVAACWLGAAHALTDAMRARLAERGGELAALHLGTVDVALHAADAALDDAACRIDDGGAVGADGQVLALRVRSIIAQAAELTINQAGHALGPAPLCFDEEHARRVADLQIYLRQHHAERDLAALGHMLAENGR